MRKFKLLLPYLLFIFPSVLVGFVLGANNANNSIRTLENKVDSVNVLYQHKVQDYNSLENLVSQYETTIDIQADMIESLRNRIYSY